MKNKKLLALFFIISVLICCSISYASEITAEQVDIKIFEIEEPKSYYTKGNTINVSIVTTIDTSGVADNTELEYKVKFDTKYYSKSVKINVSRDTITQADTQPENVKDFMVSDEDNEKKISFKWAIDVEEFINDCDLEDKDYSRTFAVDIFSNDRLLKSKDWGKLFLAGKVPDKPPIINAKLSDGKAYTNGWAKENVTISFSRDTWSIKHYLCNLSGATNEIGKEIDANGSFEIINEGTTTVTAKLIDEQDNESLEATKNINIDRTKPEITIGEPQNGLINITIKDPTNNAEDGKVSGINTRNLIYLLTTSTPDQIGFNQDQDEENKEKIKKQEGLISFNNPSYNVSLSKYSGTYYLYVVAEDNAGNIKTTSKGPYNIDNVKPTITFKTSPSADYQKSVDVEVDITDDQGLNSNKVKYLWEPSTRQLSKKDFDNGKKLSSSYGVENRISATISSESNMDGLYYLWVYAEDNFGNYKISNSGPHKIDNVAPNIVKVSSNDLYKKIQEAEVKFEDAGSGIDSQTLKYFWSTESIDPSSDAANGKFTNSFTNSGLVKTSSNIADGDYYLYLQCCDKVGNKTSFRSDTTYKVDCHKPEITIDPNERKFKRYQYTSYYKRYFVKKDKILLDE